MGDIDTRPLSNADRLRKAQADAIEAGMWKWEPGTLSSHTLKAITDAALHDLWCDSYRGGAPALQRKLFRERLEDALRTATGHEFRVS